MIKVELFITNYFMYKISKINLGRILMLLLALLISINGVITKKLLDIFPQWEVIFFNALTCLIVSLILIITKGAHNFKVKNILKHFIMIFYVYLKNIKINIILYLKIIIMGIKVCGKKY